MNEKIDLGDAVVLGYYEGFECSWCIAVNNDAVKLFEDYLESERNDGESLKEELLPIRLYGMPVTCYAYHELTPIDFFYATRSLANYAEFLQAADSSTFHEKPFNFDELS